MDAVLAVEAVEFLSAVLGEVAVLVVEEVFLSALEEVAVLKVEEEEVAVLKVESSFT